MLLPYRKYDIGQYIRITPNMSELISLFLGVYERREAIMKASHIAGGIYEIVDVEELEVRGTLDIYYTIGNEFSGLYKLPEKLISNFN